MILRCRAPTLLVAALLAHAALPSHGQAPRILFDRVSLEEGLSQSAVNAILQDRQGFLWFATQEGLNRYDGYSFEVYGHDPEDPSSLPQSVPLVIREDRDGLFWVGFEGGGLSRFDPAHGTAVRYHNDPSDPSSLSGDLVRDIYLADGGSIWVGTNAGLNRFDPSSNTFHRFNHNPADPNSLSADRVNSIIDAGGGALWLATSRGLDRLDRATGSVHHLVDTSGELAGLSSDPINVLFIDSGGILWVGTQGGVYRLDPETEQGKHYRHDPRRADSLSNDNVRAIAEDVQGTIWIGTSDGLSRYRPETDTFWVYRNDPADETSLHYSHVVALLQDRGGVLWVGHNIKGLSKWNVSTGFFPHYRHEPGNPASITHNVVTSFFERADGKLWIGTFGGGLDLFDLERGLVRAYRFDPADPRGLADDSVMSLLVDSQQRLWVGTLGAGLLRLERDGRRFTRYPYDPNDPTGLSEKGVTSILEDPEGVLWVGTYRGGLDRFDPENGTFVHYLNQPGNPTTLSHDTVTCLAQGEEGILWVGTENGGLNRFDVASGTFTRFVNDPADEQSLSSNAILSLHLAQDGTLWIGTLGGGLNRWRPEARQAHRGIFTRFTTAQGLANNFVHGILEDEGGNLWMSTNRGLSRFDPTSETFRNYDTRQGLQSEEFNHGAAHRTSGGVLLFGGINGFNAFLPERIHPNTHVPPVVITAIRKINEDMELPLPPYLVQQIELTHRDYVVSFEFAALDYTAPEKNRYAYRLDGFEEDWVDLGSLRRATYTNLPPGRYTLQVRGSNNDGVWNEQGASLGIRVVPPPWKTWWAYSLYGLLGLAVVASYTRAQARKLEQEAEYSRKLEREVATRTAELARRNEQLEQANRSLEEASLTDSLTGLRNRRFVVTNIEEEIALAERRHEADRRSGNEERAQKPDFLFLMFDLDGLKQINDNHGHATGDRLLLGVRDLLEKICRKSDTVVRWGGDEFLIVGRDANPDAAELLAERVRKAVAEHPFDLGLEQPVFLSCSLGFAFHPFAADHPEALNWEQVLAVADRALYAAKKSGRNAWVGILGADKGPPPEDFFQRLFEEPDKLAEEDYIRIRTSLDDPSALVWEM